jgi:hypothetical protein
MGQVPFLRTRQQLVLSAKIGGADDVQLNEQNVLSVGTLRFGGADSK